MTAIKITSKNYSEDNNLKIRKRAESEYFGVKNLAFILFDLIPYENKDLMISQFENLFSSSYYRLEEDYVKKKIMDITKTGNSEFWTNLGIIANSKKLKIFENQPIQNKKFFFVGTNIVNLDLPDEIDYIKIIIGQQVDFCYYVCYYCYINKDYWNQDIRYTYIHSRDLIQSDDKKRRELRGPEKDPSITNYENNTVKFLSNFIEGIFINNQHSIKSFVPSIRILSTPSINFSNIKEWETKHYRFLEYLQLSFYDINRYNICKGSVIIFTQDNKIFQNSFVPKGITMLYSEDIVPENENEAKISRILSNSEVYIDSIKDYFHALYWSVFHIYHELDYYKEKLKEITKDITNTGSKLDTPKQQMNKIANFYVKFVTFGNKEKINIRTSEEVFKHQRSLVGPPAFTINLFQFPFFKDMSTRIEKFLRTENILIEDIQKQIETLFYYYKDISNFELNISNLLLQKRIKHFTIITIIVSIGVPIISKIFGL